MLRIAVLSVLCVMFQVYLSFVVNLQLPNLVPQHCDISFFTHTHTHTHTHTLLLLLLLLLLLFGSICAPTACAQEFVSLESAFCTASTKKFAPFYATVYFRDVTHIVSSLLQTNLKKERPLIVATL